MQTENPKNTDGNIDPREIWNTIVRITDAIGTEEAKSIRVLLYLAFVSTTRSTFPERIKARAKNLRRVRLPLKKKPGQRAEKGQPLFGFLYDTPANTNNLLPVYRAAEARGWNSNFLVGEGVNLRSKGVHAGGCAVGVSELMTFTTAQEWLQALVDSRRQFRAVRAECERHSRELAELVDQSRNVILDELALGMASARGLRRLYEAWEPGFVVSSSNMWPFDHQMYVEARRLGIPSFVVQHGIINWYWWPFIASKMLLWGNTFEQDMLRLGAPVEMLSICGMPAADHLFAKYQKNGGIEHRAGAVSFVVLSDTQARVLEPELYARYKKLFIEVVRSTPQIQWSIKLHPLEDESFYRELLDGRFPNFRILPKSTTLEQAVTQADVACTLWSTSGLEAMMMSRPLLVFGIHPIVYQWAWWPKSGGGVYATTVEEVAGFAKEAGSDAGFLRGLVAKQNEFLKEHFANPGHAAQACLDLIEKMMNEEPQNCRKWPASLNKGRDAVHG